MTAAIRIAQFMDLRADETSDYSLQLRIKRIVLVPVADCIVS